jgi:hypothetical protein
VERSVTWWLIVHARRLVECTYGNSQSLEGCEPAFLGVGKTVWYGHWLLQPSSWLSYSSIQGLRFSWSCLQHLKRFISSLTCFHLGLYIARCVTCMETLILKKSPNGSAARMVRPRSFGPMPSGKITRSRILSYYNLFATYRIPCWASTGMHSSRGITELTRGGRRVRRAEWYVMQDQRQNEKQPSVTRTSRYPDRHLIVSISSFHHTCKQPEWIV